MNDTNKQILFVLWLILAVLVFGASVLLGLLKIAFLGILILAVPSLFIYLIYWAFKETEEESLKKEDQKLKRQEHKLEKREQKIYEKEHPYAPRTRFGLTFTRVKNKSKDGETY